MWGAMKQCASGTGTDTASQAQWILAECYGWKYFFLTNPKLTRRNQPRTTVNKQKDKMIEGEDEDGEDDDDDE